MSIAKKPLSADKGDFYHINAILSEEDQDLLYRVHAFMVDEVADVGTVAVLLLMARAAAREDHTWTGRGPDPGAANLVRGEGNRLESGAGESGCNVHFSGPADASIGQIFEPDSFPGPEGPSGPACRECGPQQTEKQILAG